MHAPDHFATQRFTLNDLSSTESLAAYLATWLKTGDVVYLAGELGAGKTTLTRHCLQAMGVNSVITSPTYTLIEPYETSRTLPTGKLERLSLLHMDLYRLNDPEELEYMGIRDLFSQPTVAFIEWPERGEGFLPDPSLLLTLSYQWASADDKVTSSEDTASASLDMPRQIQISAEAERLATFNYN